MPKTTDTRPLVERLQKRVLKLHGGNAEPVNQIAGGYLTDSDSALHQQSVEEINRLTIENERLRKHIQGYRDVRDVPLLKNYAPYRDLDKPTTGDLDKLVDEMRRSGLSIDGDNAYKRDLCASIIGTMAFGRQDRCPPPAGHWAQDFWNIGRSEGVQSEEFVQALELVTDCFMKALRGDVLPDAVAGKAIATAAEVITKATGTTITLKKS